MVTPQTNTIKGYVLLECIGEGAFGAVYRARQPSVDREVAIKVIKPEYANQPAFIRRFETEAQIIANLEHIHIVPLYDFWRDPDGAYLVMRLMRGGSLEEAISIQGPWKPEDASRLLDQIASALDSAHKKGIIHRDLKPANILLDEAGYAYLSDFGIAKVVGIDEAVSETTDIKGTPFYLSPEQIRSQSITPRTDVYALGVLLFELLSGDLPFSEFTPSERLVQIIQEPLPSLSDNGTDFPAAFDRVIQRATSKNPEDRYPDTLSMAENFRREINPDFDGIDVSRGEPVNPYKGLRAFQVSDANDFFGRDALIGQLLAHLAVPGEYGRFLAVVGPSGSGKSSVVKAGLMPALRKGALPGSEQWFMAEMHPGSHPLDELALALLGIASKGELQTLVEQLKGGADAFQQAVRAALPSEDAQLLLVIDQFEELFVLVDDENERDSFLDDIYEAVADKGILLRVVITLRADFYDRPLMHPNFGKLVESHTAVVLPLNADELAQAIQKPADRAGVIIEQDLVSTITSHAINQPGALPQLQYALTELFENREDHLLTNKAYQEIGGVLGALSSRAEEIYSELDRDQKNAARQLFLRLVSLGEGTEDTRRRVIRGEIESLGSTAMTSLIDLYDQARLLTFDHDPETRSPTVELAHEALFKEWHRLRNWLDESRADVRTQRLLSRAAAEWQQSNQEGSFLLRGSRLAQFEDWSRSTTLVLTEIEQSFLDASLDSRQLRETEEAMRRTNELKQISIGLGSQALLELEGTSPERAVPLALEALEEYPYTWQAEKALGQAVLSSRQKLILDLEDDFQTAMWSSDGRRILTCSMDLTIRIWDAFTGEILHSITDGNPVMASWSPDDKLILAINQYETKANVWATETGNLLYSLTDEVPSGPEGSMNSMDWNPWSPNGDRFIIYHGSSGEIYIYDAANGEVIQKITGVSTNQGEDLGAISQVLWSPGGRIAISSPVNNEVIIFRSETGQVLQIIKQDFEPGGFVLGTWSPGGESLAVRGKGGVKVYDAESGALIFDLSTPGVFNRHVSWSPDGKHLLTSGHDDGTIRLWDAENGRELDRIPSIIRGGTSDWTPDGNLAAATASDGFVHLWDAYSGREIRKISGTMNWAVFIKISPDGKRLFTSGDDNTINVFDISSSLLTIPVSTHAQRSDVTWSPSGDRFTFCIGDPKLNLVKIWDSRSGEELLELSGNDGTPKKVAWSPHGDKLAVAGEKTRGARIWDVSTGKELLCFSGHERDAADLIWSPDLDWSPDGRLVATSGIDNEVILWDSYSAEVMQVFTNHNNPVWCVRWSPDGKYLLSTCKGEAKIWEAATGKLLHDLFPQEFSYDVSHCAWAKDGSKVYLISTEGAMRKYSPKTGELISKFTTPPTSPVTVFSLSPTEERVLVGGHAGKATVLDTESGAELLRYEIGGIVAVAYSPDGKRILLGSSEGKRGKLQIYPTWHSTQELIYYARQNSLLRELSPDERERFGLPNG